MKSILLLAAASPMFAQSATDKVLQSSVVVFGTVQENGKTKPVSRGGGFMVDSRHVVTNLSACCGKTDRGQIVRPVVVAGEKDASNARVVWSNAEAEIAILELQEPFSRPGMSIAPFKTVEKEQAVYTAQFPDPGESGTTPKISEGKITGLVKLEKSALQVYKTSASMNKANSGGALFDACANVIGINMMVKDGAQFAYVVDPLLDGLRAVGVQAKVVETHCGSVAAATSGDKKGTDTPRGREWRLPNGAEWIPVGLFFAAILLAFRPSRKKDPLEASRPDFPDPDTYVPLVAPLAPQAIGTTPTRPALRSIAGQYAGKSFSLDAGPSVLGRDQHGSNLVFARDAHSISKRHCRVSWDAQRGAFVIEDLGSTNGTFLATGERLMPGQPHDLAAGGRFFVGDSRNQFEVRME